MAERPDLNDKDADPDVWSNTSVGGDRLTWREEAERLRERLDVAEAIVSVVSDLDRCIHGLHETDDCACCYSRNDGNPYLKVGHQIGTDLAERAIVWPGYPDWRDPAKWNGEADGRMTP